MPDINISSADLMPTAPLHWTTILHYIVLVSALFLLITSGDKASLLHIFILAALALVTGADLYVDRLVMPQLLVFIFRVLILGIPLIMAGLAPTEQTRSFSVVTAIIAAPILAMTFFSCILPRFLADPRIVHWCR